jgi:hypothetical protein
MAKDRYLIGSRAFRSLQSTLQAWRVRLTREGVRDEHLADAFYLTCRSRYHFGVHWRASRNCKFYPLYSPAAIKAAHSLPESERLANRVGFDLMHRFSPELTQLPFANKTWNPLIMSNPPSPITTQSASLFDPLEAPICLYPKHARRKSPLERELRKRGLRATIIRFQGILDDFHRSQRTFNFESLSPVFKPKAVSHVLSADPVLFDSNRAVCKGCRLLAAYLWANHMEIPPSRVVVASM